MNTDLIRNLAKMAHSDALSEYRHRMQTEFAGDVIFADIYDQKFSELIVLECIRICMRDYNGILSAPQAPWIVEQLKQHFGVDE